MMTKNKLCQHPHTRIIRDYVSTDVGLPVEKIERAQENKIYWGFELGESEVFIMIYEVPFGHRKSEVFLWVNIVLAKLDGRSSKTVMKYLLSKNFELPHIFRFSIDKDSKSICAQFRIAANFLTEAHLQYRLSTLGLFALESFEKLRREFDLRSYQKSFDRLKK